MFQEQLHAALVLAKIEMQSKMRMPPNMLTKERTRARSGIVKRRNSRQRREHQLQRFLFSPFTIVFLILSLHGNIVLKVDAWWLSASGVFRTKPPKKRWFSSPSKNALPSPMKHDEEFMNWCEVNGIFAPSVQCLTTYHSVGERGLFTTEAVEKGQVLASIPHELVLHSDHVDEEEPHRKNWAAHITEHILRLNDDDCRRQWIATWSGGGCTCWEDALNIARPELEQDPELRQRVKERLGKRIETWLTAANDYQLHEHDFCLYSMVYSRACYLGPTWGSHSTATVGVVPLFDMLNHDSKRHNVKLVSVSTAFAEMDEGAPRPKDLDAKDMLLVATDNIAAGKELLTEYFKEVDKGIGRADIQARKLVQWGFL